MSLHCTVVVVLVDEAYRVFWVTFSGMGAVVALCTVLVDEAYNAFWVTGWCVVALCTVLVDEAYHGFGWQGCVLALYGLG